MPGSASGRLSTTNNLLFLHCSAIYLGPLIRGTAQEDLAVSTKYQQPLPSAWSIRSSGSLHALGDTDCLLPDAILDARLERARRSYIYLAPKQLLQSLLEFDEAEQTDRVG